MLGTRGAYHRANTEHVFIKLDDPAHPLNRPWPSSGFDYSDEFFRPQGTYSRQRDRVLLSIDTRKTDLSREPHDRGYRADNDYALAWVRQYGRGRVFYCAIAHHPSVFWDPKMLEFYLAAAQFAVGDLPAPTTPSGRLTPAIAAQEKLGLRLGLEAAGPCSLFETIDKAAELGLLYVGGLGSQPVSREIPNRLGPQLTSDQLREVRLKLDAAGARLLTYTIDQAPADPNAWRQLFEFGKKLGIETFVGQPTAESLDTIERLCNQYEINLAIAKRDRGEAVLELCRARSPRIGAYGDLGAGIGGLHERLITMSVSDVAKTEPVIRELCRLGVKPTMLALRCDCRRGESLAEALRSVRLINEISIRLAQGGVR